MPHTPTTGTMIHSHAVAIAMSPSTDYKRSRSCRGRSKTNSSLLVRPLALATLVQFMAPSKPANAARKRSSHSALLIKNFISFPPCIGGQLRQQQFQRNIPAQSSIAREVDFAHTSSAESPLDLVGTYTHAGA